MQLTQKQLLAKRLQQATCTLLATTPLAHAASDEDKNWNIDSAVLIYNESDRVQALEPVISGTYNFGDEHILSVKLTGDLLTGASATGATPTNEDQVFTRPSGKGSYTTKAGETPLDDTFRDTRVALSGSWSQPFGANGSIQTGVNVSSEYDFLSFAGNFLYAHDFNQKNTTLSFGLSLELDSIEPEGGIPTPFGTMERAGDPKNRSGSSDDKTIADLMIGWTQIVNSNALFMVNYGFSQADGYQTDPFKILSVIDPIDGTTVDLDGAGDGFGRYVYEKRPDSRTKHSLFGLGKYYWNGDVIDLSYRFMTDDWGINSHTLDAKYRWKISDRSYLQPHFRYYNQSAADFFAFNLIDGEALPKYASADYRLNEMSAYTLGATFGSEFWNGKEWSVRLEYYLQTGNGKPASAIGVQRDYDLMPDVDALLLQFSLSF